MMASIGINAIVINNVNVHENENIDHGPLFAASKTICRLFAKYGIKLYTSVNFAAPMELDNFTDCDPLNPLVADGGKRLWHMCMK